MELLELSIKTSFPMRKLCSANNDRY